MRVLIVDDEPHIRESIIKFLKLEQITGIPAQNGLSAVHLLEEEVFDLAVIDLKMPGMDGIALLKWIQEHVIHLPVIMISAFGEIKDAVQAMKLGARDYLVKPFDPDELVIRIRRLFDEENLYRKVELGKHIDHSRINFIGENQNIRQIKQLIIKIADTPSNVIITGESGTGKEILARSIHLHSARHEHPFVPINLGGIPENLLESELFGYEKGAFTSANERKPGLFETANQGSLFLDEIGDLPLPLQVKLLRVLQDRKIQRLGGLTTIPINARIITATNKNLENAVKNGTFREDLFFRLNVIRIELPPLRERLDDLPLLIGFFIKKFNLIFGKTIKGIEPEALTALTQYSFPGNIRELENMLERAFIFTDTDQITLKSLSLNPDNQQKIHKTGKLKNLEKEAIIAALQKWESNRTKAAQELGFTRRTLLNKIKEYRIDL